MGLLDGKVAVISGAAGGIGRATAKLFAQEGAKLVVNDSGTDLRGSRIEKPGAAEELAEELSTLGASVIPSPVSVVEDADSVIDLAYQHFGRLDAVVCSAGILRNSTFLKLNFEDLDAHLAVHLKAALGLTQAAAKRMVKAKQAGSLVVSMGGAALRGNQGQAAYAAASSALYGLMRTAALELRRYDIRFNAVSPLAKTRQTQDLPVFEHVDSMQPEHIAPLHLFLCSELGSSTTGEVLSIAGGRLSSHRLAEAQTNFAKDSSGLWTAEEIAQTFM